MSISIERKAMSHLQRPVQLNCLFFALTAMAMPFHASMAADAASGHGVTSVLRSEVTTDPAKASVAPTSCLLAFGGIPQKIRLLPGISKGVVNPGAVRATDPSAKTRTWSEPDRQELGIMWHYIEISSSRFGVRGAYSDALPYHVEMLALRDPAVALPCGLRVGQSMDQFIKVLGQPIEQPIGRSGPIWEKVEYSGHEYRPDSAERAPPDIMLWIGPNWKIREIQWEYVID